MKYYCKKCLSVFEPGVLKNLVGYNCPMCKEVMEAIPYYETPEQYKKRTGKEIHNLTLVWWRHKCEYGNRRWDTGLHVNVVVTYKREDIQIVIADPPTPPPSDWRST